MDGRIGLDAADHPYTGHKQQDGDEEFGVRQAELKHAGVLPAASLGSIHAQPFRLPKVRGRLKNDRSKRINREN